MCLGCASYIMVAPPISVVKLLIKMHVFTFSTSSSERLNILTSKLYQNNHYSLATKVSSRDDRIPPSGH